MVSFISIAFVVVKLNISKFCVPIQHPWNSPFLEVFRTWLSQIWPNVAEILTRVSTLANTNIVWKTFEGFKFLQKRDGPKVWTFGPTLTSVSPWRWPKSKTISCREEKLQPLGCPSMSKSRLYISFPGKIRLLFALFGQFLAGNRTGSQVKGTESKFDITFFTHTIPGQRLLKSFGSSTFQFCGYRLQWTFQKNLNADFQV